MDTLGPMARTVEDAAAMLSVMAGRDSRDGKTALIPFDTIPDYRSACRDTGLASCTIGVPRHTLDEVPTPILASFEALLDQLRAHGISVVDCEFAGLAACRAMTSDQKCDFMAGQFVPALAEYFAVLATNPHDITSLAAAAAFTRATEAEEFPTRPIDRFERALAVTGGSAEFRAAAETQAYLGGEGGIQGALDTFALDAIIVPTAALDTNYLAGAGGNPQVAVPLGYLPADSAVERNATGRLVDLGPHAPSVRPRCLPQSLPLTCLQVHRLAGWGPVLRGDAFAARRARRAPYPSPVPRRGAPPVAAARRNPERLTAAAGTLCGSAVPGNLHPSALTLI